MKIMKIKSFFPAFLVVVLFNNVVKAQSTVAPFLNIVTDARSAGMGDVGVASSADGNSLFHNASKLVFSKSEKILVANYTPWLRTLTDDIFITNVSYQSRINERSGFAAGIKYFNFGDVEVTQGAGDIQTPTTINPYELAVEAAYALKLSEYYSMGVGLRYFRSDLSVNQTSTNDISPINGFAVDISGYYKSREMAFEQFNGVIKGGFNISNIGPKVAYTDGRENFIPTNLKLGGGFDFIFDDYNQLGATLELTKLLVPLDSSQDENFISGIFSSLGDDPVTTTTIGLGGEYLYNESFAFRGGYFREDPDNGNRKFYTVGAGFKATNFNIDVSYLISTAAVNNPLENTLRFSVSFDLGEVYDF